MSTHIQYEKNSMRKSHRITVPMKIHINNTIFDTINWSLTGASIKASAGQNFVIGILYDAVMMLGMKDATISLKVTLKCIYEVNGLFGFEFVNLSDKNKKVLRRYLEFYLDGKLDNVDGLLATFEEPELNSAISEPVKLSDSEKDGLKKSFFRRSIGAILLALFLFAAIATLLYQNLLYQFESAGTVERNYKKIYPLSSGIIDKIYVKSGDKVSKNMLLVDLNSEKILYEIKLLESIKRARTKEKRLKDRLDTRTQTRQVPQNDELLRFKRARVDENYHNLQNAKIQFQNHLITKRDLNSVYSAYQDAKEKYAMYKKQLLREQQYKSIPDTKVINIEEIDLKIAQQKRILEDLRLFSKDEGFVYEVNFKEGDRVDEKDAILTLWTKNRPIIIAVVSAYKANKLQIGSTVDIIDSVEGQKFTGTIRQIKSTAFEEESTIAKTRNFNDIFVIIEPEIAAEALPPHSMVKVLFKRTFGF